jgi:uncharacterized protein YjbK
MGKVRGTYGKEERFGEETRGKDHLEDLGLDRIMYIKMDDYEIELRVRDWINLAQNTER